MKMIRFLACLPIIFSFACSQEEKLGVDPPAETRAVTLAGMFDNVNVLVFKDNGSDFLYKQTVNSGWSVDGIKTISLEQGTYKFLYYKTDGILAERVPASLTETVSFDSFEWKAQDDSGNGSDYVLPVDEMWLPETSQMAEQEYVINSSSTTVSNTLTRAVSQVIVHLRKGTQENNGSTQVPQGSNMLLGNLILDIEGVGKSVTIAGSSGSGKTKQTIISGQSDGEVFASFEGPFVFPSENDATINISYQPASGIPFPEITTSVTGPLNRNKKLEITLWVNDNDPVDEELQITVEVVDMEDSDDSGDVGKWE